ncbi:MAG: hypothetical protein K9G67_15565 [Bacteroidales bacterium]|nr:hypothetical protein [Bacteroidales bacterium]MCF8343988.1 hypothetical protein [Bacteroidales bacterium]MCF8350412.1 hypothetical protein [Bacteroidales bacterium]MCF8377774.1 hypothetical protein [Bacteroidales bacterium]
MATKALNHEGNKKFLNGRMPDNQCLIIKETDNIDFVLVQYNEKGQLIDFASLEVQGVYISENLRNPFEEYIKKPSENFEWPTGYNYPKPDYLSSSRKRLIPQMLRH